MTFHNFLSSNVRFEGSNILFPSKGPIITYFDKAEICSHDNMSPASLVIPNIGNIPTVEPYMNYIDYSNSTLGAMCLVEDGDSILVDEDVAEFLRNEFECEAYHVPEGMKVYAPSRYYYKDDTFIIEEVVYYERTGLFRF